MKTINCLEIPASDVTAESGIHWGVYHAYHKAKENGNATIDFNDVIWDRDIEPIVNFCRENGVNYFTVSSTFSGLLETLDRFQKLGCQLGAITEVTAPYKNFMTKEWDRIPAIIVKL